MLKSFRSRMNAVSRIAISATIGATFLIAASGARADIQKRVALVIGNGAYEAAPKLTNPVPDAKAMVEKLVHLGYDVTEGYNLTETELRLKVGDFSVKAQTADAVLVYYAGHGIANAGHNYLIPVDLNLKRSGDLSLHALSLDEVLRQMNNEDNPDNVKVVILDACRDNPFAKEMASSSKRAAPVLRGLEPVELPAASGTMIVYATSPEKSAIDGTPGEHGPFAEALLEHVEDPNTSISDVMDRVRETVYNKTNHVQLPWANSSLIGKFVLNPVATPPDPAKVVASIAPDAAVAPAPRNPAPAVVTQPPVPVAVATPQAAQPQDAAAPSYGVASASSTPVKLPPPNVTGAPPNASHTAPLIAQPPVAALPSADPDVELRAEIGTQASDKALNLSEVDIKRIQSRLALLGFYRGNLTGSLDDATRTAIGAWQDSRGIQSTGNLGPLQFQALQEVKLVPPPPDKLRAEVTTMRGQAALGLTTADIRELQLRLGVLQFMTKPANGQLDKTTSQAIAQWQAQRGIPATGLLGPLQIEALKADSEDLYERQTIGDTSPAPGGIEPTRVLSNGGSHSTGQYVRHQHWTHQNNNFNPLPFIAGFIAGKMLH